MNIGNTHHIHITESANTQFTVIETLTKRIFFLYIFAPVTKIITYTSKRMNYKLRNWR